MATTVSERGGIRELVVTGPWTAEATAAVRAGLVDRLVLNYALGFGEPSLNFLTGFPLRELIVIDRRLTDIDPIYSLASSLRVLQITIDPGIGLDLTRLPGLEELAADWSQVSRTVASAHSLRVAHLRGYAPDDLLPLSGLSRLSELVMKDRPRISTLGGLENLPFIQTLGVYLAKNLSDIEQLAQATALERLALEGCKRIHSISSLRHCRELRSLNLGECGDLASIAPLGELSKLEEVRLFGSTRIADGDLKPLLSLPRLRELRMMERRSYEPSVKEVQSRLTRS